MTPRTYHLSDPIARGDGIGPEIMDATLRVLEAAHAPIKCSEIVGS